MNRSVLKPQPDLCTPPDFTADASSSSPLHSSKTLSRSAWSPPGDTSPASSSSHIGPKSCRTSTNCISSNAESMIDLMAHSFQDTLFKTNCSAHEPSLDFGRRPLRNHQSPPTDHGADAAAWWLSNCARKRSLNSCA